MLFVKKPRPSRTLILNQEIRIYSHQPHQLNTPQADENERQRAKEKSAIRRREEEVATINEAIDTLVVRRRAVAHTRWISAAAAMKSVLPHRGSRFKNVVLEAAAAERDHIQVDPRLARIGQLLTHSYVDGASHHDTNDGGVKGLADRQTIQILRLLAGHGPAACHLAGDVAALLEDRDPRIRGEAALSLSQLGASGGVYAGAVTGLLADSNQSLKTAALTALAGMKGIGDGHAGACADVITGGPATRGDASARAAAAVALGALGRAAFDHSSALLAALDDTDPTVRAKGIAAIMQVLLP